MSACVIPGEAELPFITPTAPSVRAYWWKGHSSANWGDWLTPLILRRFSRLTPIWTERGNAEVVCIGSILGHIMGPWYRGTILGAGKLFPSQIVPPHANILALRGPLTAKGVPGTYALGDPGLLADELVRIETKKWDIALIPHWSDTTLAHDPQFTQYPHIVVDPAWDPLSVVQVIAESKKVVSSSLHGLILADALNLPRRFEASANWNAEGGVFKVKDHCAAVGLPFAIGKLQTADQNRVRERQMELTDAFREYGNHYDRP